MTDNEIRDLFVGHVINEIEVIRRDGDVQGLKVTLDDDRKLTIFTVTSLSIT